MDQSTSRHAPPAPNLDHESWFVIENLRGEDNFFIDRFSAASGQAWCLIGRNRSGIGRFVELVAGNWEPDTCGRFSVPETLAVVSFRQQQELFEAEVRKDESDFLDRVDPGTPARSFIGPAGNRDELIRLFRLDHVLDSGYRQLSSGESRKLLLLQAITHGAEQLLIENPYDGLDARSREDVDRTMVRLLASGISIIITLTSSRDLPGWCTHLGVFVSGSLVLQGEKAAVVARLEDHGNGQDWGTLLQAYDQRRRAGRGQELVKLVAGRARYGERTIFSGLDVIVHEGEHTLITGPNGAGKSTLLALITGDHPDCYTNELYLFGIRRGSGESIWQLKQQMGIVSPALHREHYVPGSTLQAVISGFFDSIGLYRQFTRHQEDTARSWLARIGLADRERTPFRRLTFAEQRLALIARALIKLPKLLILDEPTQGLDDANRASLLNFLETVAEREFSTILYVSHREDEYRDFFRSHLTLGQYGPSS